MASEPRSLPWRKQKANALDSMYTSFGSIDGMAEMDDSKAVGVAESVRSALRTTVAVLVRVIFMPPTIVAEACSEQGGLDGERMRMVMRVLTKRRLCVGWVVLNLVTPISLYSVSSPAMAKAVLGAHVAALLSIPAALIGVALLDPSGWDLRDANDFERALDSEHILDVRPNRENVLKGLSAVLVQLQFVSLQFGVPVVDPGGSPFRLPGEGTIWGEDVDQFVSHFMHYGLDILWWIPGWSRYSEVIVSVLVWVTLVWCAVAQVTNARQIEDEREVKSRSLRPAYSFLTGIGLFCVVVALIRSVSRYMECPIYSGSDGLDDAYCSIVLPDDRGQSISSMLYRRPQGALQKLCGGSSEARGASKCSCVDRQDSTAGALIALLTMSYYTVWAVFVRAVPSIATAISAKDLDIVAPRPVQSAECLTRIVVASVSTIISPHMGRQGDKALAVLSCMVATGAAVLLCTRLWTYTNVRNVNQISRTATACAAWIGVCSVWATLDQSCIADHKAVALGAGCATIAAGNYARSVCCTPKVAVGVRESLLNHTEVADTTRDIRTSFRDTRPEYGLHRRQSLQRCRLLGLGVVASFTLSMVWFAWVAGLDKCREFSSAHDGENATVMIETICWAELASSSAECPDLRQPDENTLVRHRKLQAWQKMQCTGVAGHSHAGDVCTLPSPACDAGWLAVSYSHERTTDDPKYMDGANVTCERPDFNVHLKPFWSSEITCKEFSLDDLIRRTTSDQPSCKSAGVALHREWKLNLPNTEVVKSPCIHVCNGTRISIVGNPDITWVGSRANRTMQEGENQVESRLLFDVRFNGVLSLSSLRINRTGWDEEEPADHSQDNSNRPLVVWQNAVIVRRQARATIQYSTLRGIQLYVDPDAASFNLSHTALVPLVDRHDGGTDGGVAGQYKLHPSCITVCRRTRSTPTYLPNTGLCDEAHPQGTGQFYVSDSILSMAYLNTPHPVPTNRSYIIFSRATFYMSSLVGGQPVSQLGNHGQKLMYTDAMANDEGSSIPLFPISRSVKLDEDKVESSRRELLSATFVECHLAGCRSTHDFCEGRPTEHNQQLAPGSDVFAQLKSLGQENSLRVNVTASTPTFGDRLLFSMDVFPGMSVEITSGSNASSGSAFFLKSVFRRSNGEWFFRGGHLRIENLRMDYCADHVEHDSWLPFKDDSNVGVPIADSSVSSLTLVNTFNLYTHIFRKGPQITYDYGGRKGMPNYDGIVSLINISVASFNGMQACRTAQYQCRAAASPDCYTDCADEECLPVLTVSTATDGVRRFLNVTQLANGGRFSAWQPDIHDQLFDWNVSWYGTYMGRQSGMTPTSDATLSILYLGAGDGQHGGGRWGVSSGFHLELHNVWLVADLQTTGHTGQPCCRPGVKTNDCKSVSDSRCGACAPVDDGTVLKPIVGQGDNSASCLPAFASNQQPMQGMDSSWRSGTISFHTVAIQYKRVQVQTNSSCDNTGDTCDLEVMETLPLNIMGRGSPFVSFEDSEFARSEPRSVFADFSMTLHSLNIALITDTPLLLWDLRQNDASDGDSGSSTGLTALREISIVGGVPRTRRNNLALRRLLLSDSQHASMEDLNLMLSLDPSQASDPPVIDMTNVGIPSPTVLATRQSPYGVFSGLSHWDIDMCEKEHTWRATMKNVMLLPKDDAYRGSGKSACIDHRYDSPAAVVNTNPNLNDFGKSRLDIVVSEDGLDLSKAIHAASAYATVTVTGSTNLVWCGRDERSTTSSRNGTACDRLNASAATDCIAAPGVSGTFYTRRPRVVGASLQDLKEDCADKMCVLQNVSLNFTSGSLSGTNGSLSSFSSCSHNHPQGTRFGYVELEYYNGTSTGGSRRNVGVATLMEKCPGSDARPSIDEMAGTCDCTQQMWWAHQDAPLPQAHNKSNFTWQ